MELILKMTAVLVKVSKMKSVFGVVFGGSVGALKLC